jgi:hypothetical protein
MRIDAANRRHIGAPCRSRSGRITAMQRRRASIRELDGAFEARPCRIKPP